MLWRLFLFDMLVLFGWVVGDGQLCLFCVFYVNMFMQKRQKSERLGTQTVNPPSLPLGGPICPLGGPICPLGGIRIEHAERGDRRAI